jgi:hypothetical protein
LLAGLPLAVVLLASCAFPAPKDTEDSGKIAATPSTAAAVVRTYDAVRAEADRLGDPSVHEAVEAPGLFEIERVGFAIRRTLGIRTPSAQLQPRGALAAPRFGSYPQWFVLFTRLRTGDEQVAALFTRESSVEPWRLGATPRLAPATELPALDRTSDGVAVAVGPDDSEGLPASPQQLLDHYAAVLEDPSSSHADDITVDSFITQMRAVADRQPAGGVHFDQRWRALPVHQVLRTVDGGVLVFGVLERADSYRVRGRDGLSFAGSEASVFIPAPVRRRATLTYRHQVLLWAPADAAPLVIGQYGGLVAASAR